MAEPVYLIEEFRRYWADILRPLWKLAAIAHRKVGGYNRRDEGPHRGCIGVNSEMMNHKSRVRAALEGEILDRFPMWYGGDTETDKSRGATSLRRLRKRRWIHHVNIRSLL